MRLRDTFRITSSGNPAVKAIREAFNGNADALREAQGIIIRHEEEIEALHKQVEQLNRDKVSHARVT